MLTISDQAFDGLENAALANWLDRMCRSVIGARSDWARQMGVDRVREACLRIEGFTRVYDIRTEDSFWKLLDLFIAFPQSLDAVTAYQHFSLSREGFSENLRVDRFLKDALKGGPCQMVDSGWA